MGIPCPRRKIIERTVTQHHFCIVTLGLQTIPETFLFHRSHPDLLIWHFTFDILLLLCLLVCKLITCTMHNFFVTKPPDYTCYLSYVNLLNHWLSSVVWSKNVWKRIKGYERHIRSGKEDERRERMDLGNWIGRKGGREITFPSLRKSWIHQCWRCVENMQTYLTS